MAISGVDKVDITPLQGTCRASQGRRRKGSFAVRMVVVIVLFTGTRPGKRDKVHERNQLQKLHGGCQE